MQQTLAVPVTKARTNIQQAVQDMLNTSWLAEIVTGSRPASEWPAAALHDQEAVNDLARAFVADMNLLMQSRRRKLTLTRTFNISAPYQAGQTDAERAAALLTSLHGAWDFINTLIGRVKAQTFNGTTPVGPLLPLSAFRKEGDVAVFQCADGPGDLKERLMVRASYVCPDDFPRKVPALTQELLAVCKQTHFWYAPAIMDGVLVLENQLTVAQEDPALVLRTGMDKDIIAHYWKEPLPADVVNPWTNHASLLACVIATIMTVFFMATTILTAGAGESNWATAGFFVSLLFSLLSCIAALAHLIGLVEPPQNLDV